MATLNLASADELDATDTVTSQSLHDMIENATLDGLASADLQPGTLVLQVSPTAPDDTAGERFWWDSTRIDGQVFRVFAEPWNIWLAVGPDRIELPFRNDSGDTLHRGALCLVAPGASAITIATGPTFSMVGFAQDTTASGSWAAVCTQGIGFVAWTSGTTNPSADIRGQELQAVNVRAGYVTAISSSDLAADQLAGGAHIWGLCFGFLTENTSDPDLPVATVNARGLRARIWGPKLAFGQVR